MEIVIDIDDEDYKRIQDIPDVFNSLTSRTYSAIRNGTPLPEHHGDLKDEREVASILLKYAHSEEGRRFANFLVSEIKDAPTIIEADKGVLEKINEKQDSLKATCKAWNEAIEKNGYVN